MPQQKLTLRSRKTGLDIIRVTPVGSARVEPGALLSGQNFATWAPYQGQAVVNCSVVPAAPVAGDPMFAAGFAIDPMTPGAKFYFPLPLSIGVAATGQTITKVVALPPQPWIKFTQVGEVVDGITATVAYLWGDIPSNASAITMPIRLEQTGNKQITQGFIIEAPAGVVYALVEWNAQNRQLLPRIGGRSTVAPTVSVRGPAGFTDTGTYTARGLDTGTQYPARYHWDYPGYVGVPFGIYVIKINHLGQTLYAALEVGSNTFETVLLLSPNDPLATGTAQVQSINVSTSRLLSEKKVTATIIATGPVDFDIQPTAGGNGYYSGTLQTELIGPASTAGFFEYRYTGNITLPDNNYTARGRLITESQTPPTKSTTFTVGSSTSEYELLELYEGTPFPPQ